ncbi:hypothetical protein [Adhaeribacter pallidiroseus]|uniref:Uncharacterized protein n=1 Tax=Adhaeribacter pallidiroseus TaxID=2072847 RepID=A0A369QM40_9BACT|nr:hypothetical protein [Adhaeribacter pallidiroseus]RDC65432.1 hypothetical protein AHMF7616_04062 [Adhaeribacter pallidiroseus]
MENKHLFIITTTTNKTVDLTKAKELRSNNLFPFGRHNYAIYRTPDYVFVKGTNSGRETHMLDTYEIIDEATAISYQHPYFREE